MPENQVVKILPTYESEGEMVTVVASSVKKGQKVSIPAEANLGGWLEVKQVIRYNKNTLRFRGVSQSGVKAEVSIRPSDPIRRFK